MKYLHLFESEYWAKAKRLQTLTGARSSDIEKVEKWLEDAALQPDDRWNMINFDELQLKELPAGPWHTNSLATFCGAELERLPENLRVEGHLYLKDMPNLVELPQGLHVGGDLMVTRCPKLESLPEGLWIGRDLGVIDVPVRHLPEDWTVKGKITILDTWITFEELMPVWKARKGPAGEDDPLMYFAGHNGPQEGPRANIA